MPHCLRHTLTLYPWVWQRVQMATEVLKCLRHYPIIQEIINVFLQYAQTCIVS